MDFQTRPGVDEGPERGPFLWPPRRGAPIVEVEVDAPTPRDRRSEEPAGRTPWRELMLDVERFWLAPIALPLPERMAEAGWAPDPLDAYCNRCGLTVGPHEADEFGCAACLGRRLEWDRFVRLGEYTGPLAEWVQDVKFTGWRALGAALGQELGRALVRAGVRGQGQKRELVVAPAPTAPIRRVTRGIDHTLALARGVGRELGVRPTRLLRARHRPSQRSVPASQRTRNVARAFSKRWPPPGRPRPLEARILVMVDDVRTSGATLSAAIRALRRGEWAGVGRPLEIWAATAAVAARRS